MLTKISPSAYPETFTMIDWKFTFYATAILVLIRAIQLTSCKSMEPSKDSKMITKQDTMIQLSIQRQILMLNHRVKPLRSMKNKRVSISLSFSMVSQRLTNFKEILLTIFSLMMKISASHLRKKIKHIKRRKKMMVTKSTACQHQNLTKC